MLILTLSDFIDNMAKYKFGQTSRNWNVLQYKGLWFFKEFVMDLKIMSFELYIWWDFDIS